MITHDDHYPMSKVVERSKAKKKPEKFVKCQCCPLSNWIVDFVRSSGGDEEGIDYGYDEVLRAACPALPVKWVWPQFNVGNCAARSEAIRAERDMKDYPE